MGWFCSVVVSSNPTTTMETLFKKEKQISSSHLCIESENILLFWVRIDEYTALPRNISTVLLNISAQKELIFRYKAVN